MPAPRPNRVKTSDLKSRILNLAQTSVYQVKLQPPPSVSAFLALRGIYYGQDGENLELLCSETALPGTSLFTHEQTNDFHGVTEKMAYRRSYDDTIDMTFYVDRDYKVIDFFDGWIDYISGQGNQNVYKSHVANFRFNYPDGSDGYRSDIFLTKFEKQVRGENLSYTFIKAFPTAITSMPVSYGDSDILRCNVSFTYMRYIKQRVRRGGLDFEVTREGLAAPAKPQAAPTVPAAGAVIPPTRPVPGAPTASFSLNDQRTINEYYEFGRNGGKSAGSFIGPQP